MITNTDGWSLVVFKDGPNRFKSVLKLRAINSSVERKWRASKKERTNSSSFPRGNNGTFFPLPLLPLPLFLIYFFFIIFFYSFSFPFHLKEYCRSLSSGEINDVWIRTGKETVLNDSSFTDMYYIRLDESWIDVWPSCTRTSVVSCKISTLDW